MPAVLGAKWLWLPSEGEAFSPCESVHRLVLFVRVEAGEDVSLLEVVQAAADEGGADQSADDGKSHDRDKVDEEQGPLQVKPAVEDDGRQEADEEQSGAEGLEVLQNASVWWGKKKINKQEEEAENRK
jgi:hypothetical protein